MTDHSGCFFPLRLKKKKKAIIQNPSLPGGWTVEMSLWYSLGLHTVITDKPQVPSEWGLGHVGFNAYSKSHLILAAFLHQSHHPLLFLFFYYSTFRSPFLYLAQMSDKPESWRGFQNPLSLRSILHIAVYAVAWTCHMVPWEPQFRFCICWSITSQGFSRMESIQGFANAAFVFTAFQGCTWWIFGDVQHPNTTTTTINQP